MFKLVFLSVLDFVVMGLSRLSIYMYIYFVDLMQGMISFQICMQVSCVLWFFLFFSGLLLDFGFVDIVLESILRR